MYILNEYNLFKYSKKKIYINIYIFLYGFKNYYYLGGIKIKKWVNYTIIGNSCILDNLLL